jgi:hypothetical protein
MIDKDDIGQAYSFTYTDCDGKEHTKTIKTPGASWHECLDDYVKFLESVFGYAIKSQVRLEEPTWLGAMYTHYPDYIEPWTGEYFTKDVEVVDELTDEYGRGE